MKYINKILAIVLAIVLIFGSVPMLANAESSSIDEPPAYPKRACVEFSKSGEKNTYGKTYADLANQFVIDTRTNPLNLHYSEGMEFDIYIEDSQVFAEAFENMDISFNVSSNTSDKTKNCTSYVFDAQILQDGWNHIDVPLKARATDLSKVTYAYISCVDPNTKDEISLESDNPLANVSARVSNVCAVAGLVYFYLPHLSVGKDESEAIITWLDNCDLEGRVILTETNSGKETEYIATKRATTKEYNSNYVNITNLKANTKYTYRVESGTYSSEEYDLNIKDFDDSFSFIQVSDIQLDSSDTHLENWGKTADRIEEYFPNTSLVLNTGDVSDSSSALVNYLRYKSFNISKTIPFAVVPGNHDGNKADNYYSYFFNTPDTFEQISGTNNVNLYDYWFSFNNVLFIALNTNIKDTKYHENFIRKVMKEQGDKFDWQIVMGHHSFYSASYHSKESDVVTFRSDLTPLFSELGIDMVLSGHDHCYDRSYIMNGTTPVVANDNFAANTKGGVLYISATTGSALKYNPPVEGSEKYSASIVEDKFGFINYEVWDGAIRLTYYSTEDMAVLDQFTLYKDDDTHTVNAKKDYLNGKFINDATFNDQGEFTYNFDDAKDISNACSVELDVLSTHDDLDTIELSLKDNKGNYIQKSFENLKDGWNHLVMYFDDAVMGGNLDYKNINTLSLTGNPNVKFAISNFLVGHIYDNLCDKNCNICKATRSIKHTYTNACDKNCNICKATRSIKHTYTNACDKSCNVCKATRSIKHTYTNACDKSCNVCKATRSIKHTYTNACDKSCNICKATRTITHSYKTTTTKATTSKNGKIVKKCSLCGATSTTTIKYAKKIKLSTTSYTYDGKIKKPTITVKDSAGKTISSSYYTVTYASGRKNVGKYNVTIKFKTRYSGSKTLSFTINPPKTTVSKVTAGKKNLTVFVTKKSTQVTGYQIQYSTSKSFKSYKTKTISSYKTTKTTLSKLSAKKTYYVRVRTYKTVGGKKYYSGWSAYKYKKTK